MKAHVYVIISVLLWGAASTLTDFMLGYVSPNLLMEFRFLLSGFILLWITRNGNYDKFKMKYFITGLLGVFGYYIFSVYALKQSSVPFVAIMGAALPVLAFITDYLISKKRLRLWELIAISFSLLSIVLFLFNSNFRWNLLSGLYMILGNISWLVYVHLKKHWNIHDDKRILGYEFISSALCFLIFFNSYEFYKIDIPVIIIGILSLVFFSTILPYMFYLKGTIKLSVTTSSIYMNMLPVATLLPVIISGFLRLSLNQMIAIILIILTSFAPLFNNKIHTKPKDLVFKH